MPTVDGPRFTAIQQCSENHCALDFHLCSDPSSDPHIFVQSARRNARLGQSSVHLVINHNVPGKHTCEARKFVHCVKPLIVVSDVGFNARLVWCWLVHSFYLFCADSEAEVVASIGELVNAMLHVSLGGSVEGAIIGEQKVVDSVRLNLGLRLQSPEVEHGAGKTPSDANSEGMSLKASVSIVGNIRLKNVVARTQPCLTPLETTNRSEDSPPS